MTDKNAAVVAIEVKVMLDAHSAKAAENMGISCEEFVARFKEDDAECKAERQKAKIANFAENVGGMGPDRIRKLSIEQAHKLYDTGRPSKKKKAG